ncbi:MAG: hypothetical protein K5925_03995 [Bacilli bacterium]|nr:hypothetical protein [Bacilli bacterium]
MKKIVCDLCGESDFVKVSGFFECQVCGAKYSIEEARSMFVDVPDDPNVQSEAPTNDIGGERENPVLSPKPAPTIVRKVVVQPKAPANDKNTVNRIVSNIKKTNDAAGVKPQPKTIVQKPGQAVTVKKVVAKPVVQQQAKVAPKKVAPQAKNLEVRPGMGLETSQMIENLFILSQNAFDSENYVDAENYANRIIELDATNSDAWLMKGNCAGKATDGKSFRFLESINCWNTALTNADKQEFEDYQFTVRTNCIDIAVTYVLKTAVEFRNKPEEESLKQIKDVIDYMEPLMRKANQTFGVEIVIYEDKLASNINAIVTSVSKDSIKAFGKKKETQTDEAYIKFRDTQDACILVWEYLMDLAKKHGTVTSILQNIVKMEEAIIRNNGHKVSGSKVKDSLKCSLSERNTRLETIKKDKKKLEDKFVDIRKRDRVEQKFKNEKYWEEHQEEKQQLLDERSKLEHEIFELENSKLKMEELKELKKLEEEVIRLTVLKDNPTYSNKERTGFMNELNKVRKQVVTKKRELASRLNPIDDKIEKYKKRMFNIDLELNQNR